jgi:2-dehydro-3-deoxygalactonokinase
MIAVDWGTSSFRAYRLDADGIVREMRATARGILTVPPGGWSAVLYEEIGDWLAGERLLMLSGMVGSRQGWREAPYAPCPAGAAELARLMVRLDWGWEGTTWLAPGLSCRRGGTPDVMRGEEVQILGALTALPNESGLICLPGTHSKWARVEAGRIVEFATYMTGEIFAVLKAHTILSRSMPEPSQRQDPEDCWFLAGIRRSQETGGMLHHLFGARALELFEEVPRPALPAYLSGILIGHELLAAPSSIDPVYLLGGEALTTCYTMALTLNGRPAIVLPADSAAAGLYRLAQTLQQEAAA